MRNEPVAAIAALLLVGCGKGGGHDVPPEKMADAVFAVISADRAVYTREVVSRLQDQEGVIHASEHYRDDRTLPLPAQMLRMGAEAVQKQKSGVTYALLSPWPINRQNAPRTVAEKAGLERVVKTGATYYGRETLGGTSFLTAVYPDKAVSEACVSCHNAHRESARHDFKVGETMGAVVIRIPLD